LQRLRDIRHCEEPYGDRGRGTRHHVSPAVSDPGTSLDFGSGLTGKTGTTATGAPRAEVSVAEGLGSQPVASDNADWVRVCLGRGRPGYARRMTVLRHGSRLRVVK
jgi:hypothetical protein